MNKEFKGYYDNSKHSYMNNRTKSVRSFNYSINFDKKRLYKRIEQLEKALSEIREYVNHEWFKREQIGICNKELQQWQIEDILQIIDNVLGDEKSD